MTFNKRELMILFNALDIASERIESTEQPELYDDLVKKILDELAARGVMYKDYREFLAND